MHIREAFSLVAISGLSVGDSAAKRELYRDINPALNAMLTLSKEDRAESARSAVEEGKIDEFIAELELAKKTLIEYAEKQEKTK